MSEPIDTIWMSELFQACPVGMAIFDEQAGIGWANPKLASLLGLPLNQLIGLDRDTARGFQLDKLFDLPTALDIDPGNGALLRSLACEYRTLTLPNNGTVQAAYYTDATENRLLSERLERLVLSDETTGVLNLRGVMRDLEPLLSRCRRYENELSLIQLEFDFAAGTDIEDAMLQLSRGIRGQLRWADLVSRTAPNSFLLVLPETNAEAAQQLAAKLISQLDSLPEVSLPQHYCAVAGWQRGNDMKMLLARVAKGISQARQGDSEQVVAA